MFHSLQSSLKTLLIVLTLSLCFVSNGQVTIYNANFENNAGVNSWTNTNYSGLDFSRGNTTDHPGNSGKYQYTQTASNLYENSTNVSITSPIIDLTGYDKMTLSLKLSYDTDIRKDGMQIRFTNDGGANWHVLGRKQEEGINWYTHGYTNTNGRSYIMNAAWSGDSAGWIDASIDLPPQAFDNQSTIQFRFIFASNNNTQDVGVAFDDVKIEGYDLETKVYPTCGLGIQQNLELWLNTETLSSLSDGDRVDEWPNTVALDPTTKISPEWTNALSQGTRRPTYSNNAVDNINYNPVVSFDGSNSMFGKSGFYSKDLFMVINPTATITSTRGAEDVFLGDDYTIDHENQDITGFSINDTSSRYFYYDVNGVKVHYSDIIAYNQGSNTSYGKAITNQTLVYDRPLILNARLKADGTGMDLFLDGVDLGIELGPQWTKEANISTFKDILNSRYWLGRSEYFGPSFSGDILEVMSYSVRKSDVDRQRIESYLAIKHGITLGLYEITSEAIPDLAGFYVDSNGNELWNETLHPGFTNNVTGIGRDDCILLNQKQAKSVDPFTFIAVGLGNIEPTNTDNSSTFEDTGDFLMWGSTRASLSAMSLPIEVTLGPSIVTTFTDVSERTWKFVEVSQNGNDIPKVKLSVSTAGLTSLPALTGNDAYVMILADDDAFTSNIETIFLKTVGTNQECFYDFDGERYVKFGVAHEVVDTKDILFDGMNDYVAMGDELELTNDYSISAWVKIDGSNSSNSNKTIVSKRAGANDGYHFYITNDNKVAMSHNGNSVVKSKTALTNNVWRYVTCTYDGSRGRIYIDGILDRNKPIDTVVNNDAKFCIGSRYVDKNNIVDNFSGSLDEIRIFSKKININQMRFMMNQEIEADGTGIKGSIIPNTVSKNDISGLTWNQLEAYFNMNTYIGTHLNDASGNGHRGSLIQPDSFSINEQTAPVPYISINDGDWNVGNSWKGGSFLFIPGSTRVLNGRIRDIDWNIVVVNKEVTSSGSDYNFLGLEVGVNGKLTMEGDTGLTVTHHLKLDGTIDLQGESQLIQNFNSDLISSTTGKIEIDQQGTSSTFDYNFWGSPVSKIDINNNNNGFTLSGVLKDGTLINNPRDLSFTATNVRDGSPGTNTTAATISGRWLYKYGNLTSNTYSNWQYVGPTGNMSAGEGFTMKGTGAVGINQNYIFVGKPNNGNINLDIDSGNDYLISNPYPSALDTHQFILDNPDIDGTVYFWEHWGGNTHILANYQGGYATYNLSGGLGNATFGTSNPDVNQGGIATKRPQRYIPVAQGFFVTGINNGGRVKFRNGQRIFKKESDGESLFVAAPGSNVGYNPGDINTSRDPRTKIRLGFDSSNLIHRQLLVTIDSNATSGYDRGYDAILLEEQMDDMAWSLNNEKLSIQGIPALHDQLELPLSITLNDDSSFSIKIDDLKNVATTQTIYVKDALLHTYVDIMNGNYISPLLVAGSYEDRFYITFSQPATLSNETVFLNEDDLIVFTPNGTNELSVKKSIDLEIEDMTLINMLGQEVKKYNVGDQLNNITVDVSQIANGNYILKMNTNYGIQTRKVILK